MTTQLPVQCLACAHLRGERVKSCDAYPDGIPLEIGAFGADHRTTRGDERDGIVFEQADTDTARSAFDHWQLVYGEAAEAEAGSDAEDAEYVKRSIGEQGRNYWTHNPEGLAKWVDHEHPLTALHRHIMGFDGMTPDRAWLIAAQWFHDVHGYWPAEREGANPVGPEPDTHRSRSGELEDEPHEEAGVDG